MRKLYAIVVIELVLAIIILSVSSVYADEYEESVYEMPAAINYQMDMQDIIAKLSEVNADDAAKDNVKEENAQKEGLIVSLTDINGQGILNKDGTVLYTASAVTFTIDSKETCYYSLSIDGGRSFGGYVEMEGNALTVYPDNDLSPNGNYQIRFMSRVNCEKTDIEIIPAEGDVSEEALNEEAINKETQNEEVQNKEGKIEEIISRVYKLQFDCSPPTVEVMNPQVLENWLSKEDTLKLKISDAGNLSKVMTISEDKVTDSRLLTGEDNISEMDYEIPLNNIAKDERGRAIDLCAVDMAGNTSRITYRYYLDEGKPMLFIAGYEDQSLINRDGQLLIGLRDDCPKSTYLSYEISRIYKGEETVENIFLNAGDLPGGMIVPVEEDGQYHVTARAFDMAGNSSNDIDIDFLVDNEAPVINIEGINAGADSKSAVNVGINIRDESYENSNVRVSVQRRKGDGEISLKESEYVLEAANDTRTISLMNDGDYTINVRAEDGNGKVSCSQANFRIDATAPLLKISGLNENEITNCKPVIRMSALESFYDATILSSVLSRKDSSGNYIPINEEKYVMKNKLDYKDISIDEEGEYRLECSISDRSGNSVSDSLDFVVDYTPPVIKGFSEYDGRFLGYFNMPDKIDSLISDMTGVSINAYINDKRVNGGETILDEGKYVLYLAAEDEAKNYSDQSATFIIDHTAPQIVLKGVGSDGYIKKNMMVEVSLLDSMDYLEEVIFNGRSIELSADKKGASFLVDDYGDYDIEVKARDEAGNYSDKIIHTSCALSAPIEDYIKAERIIAQKIRQNDINDINFSNYIIGVITMLSGTMGLVMYGLRRD